ncbi:hypothetical protein LINPERPRIM_LOCUS17315, partial [Linum perenne]
MVAGDVAAAVEDGGGGSWSMRKRLGVGEVEGMHLRRFLHKKVVGIMFFCCEGRLEMVVV